MRSLLLLATVLLGHAAFAAASEAWTPITKEKTPGLAGDEIQFIGQTPDGSVWIGTLTGVSRFKNGRFELLKNQKKEPLGMATWTVIPAGDKAWWIGYDGGAMRWSEKAAQRYLGGYTIASILPAGEGRFWCLAKHRGTERNRLMRFDGEAWTPVAAFAERTVVDIRRAGDGTFWITLEGDGVCALDPTADASKAEYHLPGMNVTAVYEDRAGRVWCGFWGGGVAVYEKNAWTRHLADEPNAVLAIAADTADRVWVATSGSGVWGLEKGKWRNFLREEGVVSLLKATPDGRVWLCAQPQGGLHAWNGKAWELALDNQFPIACVMQAEDGTVWAGGVLDGLHLLKSE